jgi:hypothetical protein
MIKKVGLFISLFVFVISFTHSQGINNSNLKFPEIGTIQNNSKTISDLKTFYLHHDSLKNESLNITGSKKSPGLAFLLSILVPGTGQFYTNRLDVGKYYMISEAALWLGFASFSIYGNWLLKDAHKYAQIHAGINMNGKDDNYFVNISNYDNIYQYNNAQLQNGRIDLLYDQTTQYFYWDNVADREKYRVDQLAGDRVITDRLFFVGAIVVNHIISAISAIILTNKNNDQLKGSKGGFTINTDVIRNGPKVDGLQLKLCKWF